MFDPTRGPARDSFPARERVGKETLDRMMSEGTIVIDNRRRRPLYFDGRFLAARDLTREQNYFLSRQADLGRVGGAGVVHGLVVSAGTTSTSIRIEKGHGVTSAGEAVVLDHTLTVDLSNITELQRLDVAFGISSIPSESSLSRSGLYVVALRPVEFTANPIASYPTSITGTRSIEDGDIVEGVAVTLFPYRDAGANVDFLSRRSRIAREIFVNRATRGTPSAALPIAMIALDGGVVRWIDPFMVRREVGPEHGNTIGLGFAPRALREAHLFQYEAHLAEVMQLRAKRSLRFAASEHFQCLPPAGRLPATAVNPEDFSQIYFPAEVDVELSIVPADEVPVLLEESLLLPPIDLTLGAEEQDSTSVQILIPVPRERMRSLSSSLTSLTRTLKPAAPGLVAKRMPLQSLTALKLPRFTEIVINPRATIDRAWAEALGIPADRMLWYVRRRNLQFKSEFVGTSTRVVGSEVAVEVDLRDRIQETGLGTLLNNITAVSSSSANAEIISFLSAEKFDSRLLMEGAIRDLESMTTPADASISESKGQFTLDRGKVLNVAYRFSNPQLGEGIAQLENLDERFKADDKIIKALSATGLVPELDRITRKLQAEERKTFAARVLEHATAGKKAELSQLILAMNEEVS